ncbi:hypothetical protein WK03_35655 [Burkholderia cepacia]|uniref:hypothetical protein n=1 Tax=Burkholderia cepacia TaxID=292 RepID=UPI0007541FE5|nr:hypothetical protein [Burkholderia cepacia]KVQ35803.1 hypothetical protein WK03_35655 [Burkholderia cepacia]
MKPTGFARIPRAEFLYPECQRCYFHNREPAICEACDSAAQFEPEDVTGHLSARRSAIVQFYRNKEAA